MTAADPRDGLLPCPFCGSDAEVDSYDAHAGTFVQCCNCGARVNGGESEWNARIAHARPEAVDGWPDYVMLRDTNLYDDAGGLGQRIFTTAGAGYKKVKYIRAALIAALTPERAP